MKLLLSCLAGLLLTSALATAAVVNDGTTTQGLLRLAPAPLFNPDSTTTLAATGQGNLLASVNQQDTYGPNFPRLHTVWYGTAYVATGATYQASAQFRRAQDAAYLDGGVVGWMDEDTGRGIVLALRQDSATYCEVAAFDFAAPAALSDTLFDTNGVSLEWNQQPAAARSALTVDFRSTNFLRLELSFEPPTDTDLEVLTNATARLRATGYQDNGSGEQVVTTPIILLTTLPEPASGEKLAGYYAVFSRSANRTGAIGWLDELVLDGEIGLGNELPSITLTSPTGGAKFASGDPIPVAATASDPAPGSVAQVEFFAGSQSLHVTTQSPYNYTWTAAPIGTHTLSAVVTDDRGAKVSSDVVSIEVTNRPPVVTVLQPGAGQIFGPGEEIIVQASAEDSDGSVVQVQLFINDVFTTALAPPDYSYSWIPIDVGSYTIRVVAVDDRGATGTSAPVTVTVGQVVVEPASFTRYEIDAQGRVQLEWDRLGFQVQSASSLFGPWANVPVNTTGLLSYSEAASAAPQYYRLVAQGVAPSESQFTEFLLEGSEMVMRWTGTGHQVQASPDLEAGFLDVATNTTGAEEYRTPVTEALQFFRLR